jgi:hypothetical protein
MFVARQSRFKPGGSKSTPATFFVTSQRLIVRDPSMMGMKEDFSSVNYDKISSVNVKKGFFSSTLKIMAEGFAGDIHAIDKRKAEKIMSYIQEKMAWGDNQFKPWPTWYLHVSDGQLYLLQMRIYPKLPDSKNKEFYQKQNLIKWSRNFETLNYSKCDECVVDYLPKTSDK